MEVKDVDLLRLQRLQRFVKGRLEVFTVGLWLAREDLGCNLESVQVQQSQCLRKLR